MKLQLSIVWNVWSLCFRFLLAPRSFQRSGSVNNGSGSLHSSCLVQCGAELKLPCAGLRSTWRNNTSRQSRLYQRPGQPTVFEDNIRTAHEFLSFFFSPWFVSKGNRNKPNQKDTAARLRLFL